MSAPPIIRDPIHNLRHCSLIAEGHIEETRTHSIVFALIDKHLLSKVLNHPSKARSHIQNMALSDADWAEATCRPCQRDDKLNTFEPRLLTRNLRCPYNINTLLQDFPRVYPEGNCVFCNDSPGTEHHILCVCPKLSQFRGIALTKFRKGVCDLVHGKLWPTKRVATQWLFPTTGSDFRYGKVPIIMREWTNAMSKRGYQEAFYVHKIRRLFTAAYHFVWTSYTHMLSSKQGHLNGRIKALYNTRSSNMHILRPMTEAQRLMFRPRKETPRHNIHTPGHRTDTTGIT
jgi:hypothetical protein